MPHDGQNTAWHGYQRYSDRRMTGKRLTEIHTVANLISVSTYGKTLAILLGLAKQSLT